MNCSIKQPIKSTAYDRRKTSQSAQQQICVIGSNCHTYSIQVKNVNIIPLRSCTRPVTCTSTNHHIQLTLETINIDGQQQKGLQRTGDTLKCTSGGEGREESGGGGRAIDGQRDRDEDRVGMTETEIQNNKRTNKRVYLPRWCPRNDSLVSSQ